MKTCPNCSTRYTDDTLRFCLQDGGALVDVPATGQPTVSFSAEGTGQAGDSVVTQWKKPGTSSEPSPAKGGGLKIALIVAALGLLVLFAAGGLVGLWLYLRDPSAITANKTENNNRNAGVNSQNTNAKTPAAPTPPPANVNSQQPSWTPTPKIDRTGESADITRQVDAWKTHAESGDLDSQMQIYAASVDYYNKRGATRDFIRADRERAYNLYDSMSIGISDLSVSVDDSGETATAVFDKSWAFDGTRRSTGKVRQELRLRKVNGQWLITGEKDLKVYRTN